MMDAEQDLLACRAGRDLSVTDLVSIAPLTLADLNLIFALGRRFRHWRTHKSALAKGCSVVNCFFESSTRTLTSFDLAAKHLGMDTNNVTSSSSAVRKGESYLDTLLTLDAYNLKIVVIRCAEAGVPEMLARHVQASIINAGDGWHEHPTQGLLDALTMLDHVGSDDLRGRVVTIVGDVRHSRVFGSLVRILHKLGATIRIAAPATLVPAAVENFGVAVFHQLEPALEGADVVYALRLQAERGAGSHVPSLREYAKMYGISAARLARARPEAILMHPGPVQRDIDIHSALVAVDPRSQILCQVENGMAVRKAVLWLLSRRQDGRQKLFARR